MTAAVFPADECQPLEQYEEGKRVSNWEEGSLLKMSHLHVAMESPDTGNVGDESDDSPGKTRDDELTNH